MSASGFIRSTPRPSGDRRSLEQQRTALWSLRDYFLRSRSEGPRSCHGDWTCANCYGAENQIISSLSCPHEGLLESTDNHGNFAADTERLVALEDAIELIEHRLLQLAISEAHERNVA